KEGFTEPGSAEEGRGTEKEGGGTKGGGPEKEGKGGPGQTGRAGLTRSTEGREPAGPGGRSAVREEDHDDAPAGHAVVGHAEGGGEKHAVPPDPPHQPAA